jgi:hypothetical protein
VGDPVPPDPIVAFAHGDCLRRVASEGHEFASPQPGREWSCFVCGEPKDVSLGTALITECGRAGDRRRGSAPKFFAHGTCARSVAHGDYEFVTVSIPGR